MKKNRLKKNESNFINCFIISIVVVIIAMGCDGDSPVRPDPEPVSDYNIYIGLFGGSGGVYIYNTKQKAIVDSILNIPRQTDIEVSADEKYLIGSSLFGGGGTWIMDLSTRELVKQFSYVGQIEVSPNGKYIAIQSSRLRILDAQTLEEILIDTIAVSGGHFDQTGDMFYGISAANTISRIDIPNGREVQKIVWQDPHGLGGLISKVVPTTDTNKIFIWIYYGSQWSAVFAYYIEQDSNRVLQNIESRNTDIELTPDEKILIFSDPYNLINSSSQNVYLAEAQRDHVYAIVPYPFIADPFYANNLNSTEIAITPDGKTCVFGSFGIAWQGVMSIEERKYVNWFTIDTSAPGAYGSTLACRKNLNEI